MRRSNGNTNKSIPKYTEVDLPYTYTDEKAENAEDLIRYTPTIFFRMEQHNEGDYVLFNGHLRYMFNELNCQRRLNSDSLNDYQTPREKEIESIHKAQGYELELKDKEANILKRQIILLWILSASAIIKIIFF